MRKVQLLILLVTISFGALAQTEVKQKVKVEKSDGKIHLIIEKEVDGKITTIDKVYSNNEEMKNDPDLEELNLHISDKSSNTMFFSADGDEGDREVQITVDIDSAHPMGDEHTIYFNSEESDATDFHDIKVWVDDDGEKHISKNGEEVELDESNTWTDKEGNEFSIKKTDGNVIIMSDSDLTNIGEDGGSVFEFKFDGDSEDGEHKVMVYKSDEVEHLNENTVTIKVIEHIKIHLKELDENEFAKMPGVDSKMLAVDDLNYYPNPNDGKFTLSFQADDKPTEIRITGIDGKNVYTETLQNFEGSYKNEIDLSAQKRGIYLLQVLQGKKVMNKKIVIE